MGYFFRNLNIFQSGGFSRGGALLDEGISVSSDIVPSPGDSVFENDNYFLFPGFADVHVHLREPGFSYKETVFSGTMAAARGGYTAVCAMPNLSPAPDCGENLRVERELIKRDAKIAVYPYGTISRAQKGLELSAMEEMAGAVGFSDDGRGVRDEGLMEAALNKAKSLGKIIAAHCEDEAFGPHDGEWRELERNLRLAERTGAALHVCHVSTRESVELLREYKARGVDVTAETAPHYLLLDEGLVRDEGRYKMNPPIGSRADREALRAAAADGTIDIIATDHAPHSAQEKAGGFGRSLSGIVGLETAFAALYTGLTRRGIISLERLIEMMAVRPRTRFGLGGEGDWCLFDLGREYKIDSREFLSMGKSTPFEGERVFGRCLATYMGGMRVWSESGVFEK